MGSLGNVRIGQKAPDFTLDAVIDGDFEEWSLHEHLAHGQWVFLLFIPAAFSFVCPTEVLAFSNCIEEFAERQTSVAFISTDTKHVMWHWQELPRKHGGLGKCSVPLLADPSHHITRSWGILVENEGVALRGMFLVDPQGLVQHVTLNNMAVGRSVLEALRLVEAFQAVQKYGVLCPANWKVGDETVTESYADKMKRISRDFGGIRVADLDHADEQRFQPSRQARTSDSGPSGSSSSRSGSISAIGSPRSMKPVSGVGGMGFTSPRSSSRSSSGQPPMRIALPTSNPHHAPTSGGQSPSVSFSFADPAGSANDSTIDLHIQVPANDGAGSGPRQRSGSGTGSIGSKATTPPAATKFQQTLGAIRSLGMASPKPSPSHKRIDSASSASGYFDAPLPEVPEREGVAES